MCRQQKSRAWQSTNYRSNMFHVFGMDFRSVSQQWQVELWPINGGGNRLKQEHRREAEASQSGVFPFSPNTKIKPVHSDSIPLSSKTADLPI